VTVDARSHSLCDQSELVIRGSRLDKTNRLTEFDQQRSPTFLSEGREYDDTSEIVIVIRDLLLQELGNSERRSVRVKQAKVRRFFAHFRKVT